MFKGTMKFLTMGFAGWEWDSNPMRIQLAIWVRIKLDTVRVMYYMYGDVYNAGGDGTTDGLVWKWDYDILWWGCLPTILGWAMRNYTGTTVIECMGVQQNKTHVAWGRWVCLKMRGGGLAPKMEQFISKITYSTVLFLGTVAYYPDI